MRVKLIATPMLAVVLAAMMLGATAQAEHRVALVIANAEYREAPLPYAAENAETVAVALRKHGFRVSFEHDLDSREQLQKRLEAFARSTPVRGTALVYFSGYALRGERNGQADGFLLPTAAQPKSLREVGGQGYGIGELAQLFDQRSGADAALIVVDGCYAHPQQAAEIPNGLAELPKLPPQTLVAYAAAPEQVLVFSDRKHSQWTERLSATQQPLLATIESISPWHASTLKTPLLASEEGRSVVAGPEHFQPGIRAGDEWVNDSGMVFCWCPPGSFVMGSTLDAAPREADEGPAEVTHRHGFWISKYELTVGQCSRKPSKDSLASHKNHPRDCVHWDDMKQELRVLNETQRKAGRLPSDWEYALPSEQQWEYAARAGTVTPWYFGDDRKLLPQHANFADRSLGETQDGYFSYADEQLNDGTVQLGVVGSYRPNPWGLHDIYGNLWEWCETKYQREFPSGTAPFPAAKDAGGPVIRGGAWVSKSDYCRSAFRQGWGVRSEQNFTGYRFVIRRVGED